MTKKQDNDSSKKSSDKAQQELEAQIDELNDALLRERADAENVRRRAEQDKIKMGGFYKALVVKELLPVIDNFERAMAAEAKVLSGASAEEAKSSLAKGVDSIYKQFGEVLQKLDVERIKTVGEPFDPHTMEAVSAEEGDGDQEIVSEELQSGYKIGDELLRPAMVRVRS